MNQCESWVSYHLTVINYHLAETTDFMSVEYQFGPRNGFPEECGAPSAPKK
jgi:hypothetical protein